MIDLKTKRITITGGKGFLGTHLVRKLREERGCPNVFVADLPNYDLRNPEHIRRTFDDQEPEIVIHLAAVVGGIGANQASPGKFFYDNAIMGIQLIHEAYLRGVDKLVILGTVCCYPKDTPVPFKEENLWNGYPEETNAPYGLAKKMLLVQSQAYRQEYGCNAIFLLPVNLYGPGDNFNPKSSHVIPALTNKFVEAVGGKEEVIKRMKDPEHIIRQDAPVVVWGTGRASREFLYVEDAAEAIIMATEKYDKGDPVNIGAGHETKINDLATLIGNILHFNGNIKWDPSKPDGQPRRMLDTLKAEREFGFCAKTGLEEGLNKTVEWYIKTND